MRHKTTGVTDIPVPIRTEELRKRRTVYEGKGGPVENGLEKGLQKGLGRGGKRSSKKGRTHGPGNKHGRTSCVVQPNVYDQRRRQKGRTDTH